MDKWFKRILGAESNKAALLAILKELIPDREISDIRYDIRPRKKSNPFIDGHDAVFDVECVDIFGYRFVVEMQQHKQAHFPERALFYSTFPIQEQVLSSNKSRNGKNSSAVPHDKQFDFPPVYVISFLNFSLHKGTDQVLFRYDLRERITGDRMTDRINFIFLEMANFRKPFPAAGDSFAEKLSFALTRMSILKERPAALIDEVFGLLFAACEIDRLTDIEQQEYTKEVMTTEMDKENILYTARMDGLEEGREEGRAEGKKETAANLKKLSIPIETIAQATGLSITEIEAL